MTSPEIPLLRVTSLTNGLQVDAEVVPTGPLRVAVVDQDTRPYDLVLRRQNDGPVILRLPPASGGERELTTDLEVGEYVIVADGRDGEFDLRATFTVQAAEPSA